MKLTDNTLKYLKEYGGLSFGERPFSHVDSLILCQLSYFKFQDLVPASLSVLTSKAFPNLDVMLKALN